MTLALWKRNNLKFATGRLAAGGRQRIGSLLQRFNKDDAGATAVEFAFVGPIFIAMTMVTMELGLGFVANKTLEFSVDQMAREVRTGQTKVRPVKAELLEALERAEDEDERQSAKDAIAADEKAAVEEAQELFRKTLCGKTAMPVFFTCEDLLIDVQQISTWADRPEEPERTVRYDEDGNELPPEFDPGGASFNIGGRQTINVIRVYYEWPSIVKADTPNSRVWVNNKRMMAATAAFLTEPF